MRLSRQEKQIMLVLNARRPMEMRLNEIITYVTSRTRNYGSHRNTQFASFSRSMRSLLMKGCVKERLVATKRFRNRYWSLTPQGYEAALETIRFVRSEMEELDKYRQLMLLSERFGTYEGQQAPLRY